MRLLSPTSHHFNHQWTPSIHPSSTSCIACYPFASHHHLSSSLELNTRKSAEGRKEVSVEKGGSHEANEQHDHSLMLLTMTRDDVDDDDDDYEPNQTNQTRFEPTKSPRVSQLLNSSTDSLSLFLLWLLLWHAKTSWCSRRKKVAAGADQDFKKKTMDSSMFVLVVGWLQKEWNDGSANVRSAGSVCLMCWEERERARNEGNRERRSPSTTIITRETQNRWEKEVYSMDISMTKPMNSVRQMFVRLAVCVLCVEKRGNAPGTKGIERGDHHPRRSSPSKSISCGAALVKHELTQLLPPNLPFVVRMVACIKGRNTRPGLNVTSNTTRPSSSCCTSSSSWHGFMKIQLLQLLDSWFNWNQHHDHSLFWMMLDEDHDEDDFEVRSPSSSSMVHGMNQQLLPPNSSKREDQANLT